MPAQEAGAGSLIAFGEIQFHIDGAVIAALDRGCVQRLQGAHAGGGQVAGNAAYAQAVLLVRRDVDINHRVIQTHDLGERSADGGVVSQFDDAVMFIAQAHFTLGTEHAVGILATDIGRLQ